MREQRPVLSAVLGAAIVAAAGGCASFAPPQARPAAPVAPVFPTVAAAVPAGTDHAVDPRATHWRAFFADPRLHALLDAALANNRDLRIALARIAEARAQLGITAADRVPGVDATVEGASTRSLVGANLVTARRSGFGLALPAFEVDLWGRVRDLSDAARATVLAQASAAQAARIALVGDVAGAWFGLLEAEERIALARRTLESREAALKLTERRERAGVSSGLDVLQARSLLESVRADLAALERQRAASRNALELLVGAPLPAAPAGAAGDAAGGTNQGPGLAALDAQLARESLRVGVPSEVLAQRPDVVAAEARLQAARANIGAARAAFFPRITLTGAVGTVSPELSGLFDASSGVWSFLPQVRLPLFDGGRLNANLDLARAREVGAVADYERTVQQAFREVADALAARAALREQVDATVRLEAAQRERLRIAERRYAEGLSSFLELLDAQRELYGAQQARVQAMRLQVANSVALYRALGGGAQDTVPAAPL